MRSSDQGRRTPSRIWLIGLMGCGKTSVGRAIAERIGYTYIDNDATIAAMAGRPTVELASLGPAVLHSWESRYVEHLIEWSAPCVAGIPASCADRPDDLARLRDTGPLVYLRCDPTTLALRIKDDPPRPWMDGDIEATIDSMFAARDSLLRLVCPVVVAATGSVSAVAAAVLDSMRERRAGRSSLRVSC